MEEGGFIPIDDTNTTNTTDSVKGDDDQTERLIFKIDKLILEISRKYLTRYVSNKIK